MSYAQSIKNNNEEHANYDKYATYAIGNNQSTNNNYHHTSF